MTADAQNFREAMSRLCAAVNIVTTAGPAGRCGLTATAVCPVTDTPPTVMVCINRNSATNAIFKENARLCVNILDQAHEAHARHFAGLTDIPMAERFAASDWTEDETDVPRLRQALASLSGRLKDVFEIGTHSVLVAEIDVIALSQGGGGLVYFGRRFASVALAS
ncbi:MAG: flavin reductase [Alphaproteobacteria bacterium]|nr:flavin reductase [Alphaproteobacteria bacterium]MBU6473833.1 flavin reductase [Alphaproteobacteria bacterium]MDE2013543.1 flavin reductase [Alphaproteobacteria bacterium]MDE2073345.1 flavin reductase [Alphaproteobacteria bacterium]MDE2351654.1 flavin reductase [Alphaproteobacteria bacterium]